MKALICLFLLAAAVSAWPNFQSDHHGEPPIQVQLDINHLLFKVTEPIRARYTNLKDAADHFDPEADTSIYKDGGEAVHKLMNELKDHRLLDRHHWFSLFNTRQREEALLLVDVLLKCKTWSCFTSNAAYFRERMNEGEFVYAFYVSVIHSDLAEHSVLPPMYEVTPHMFTNSEVIQKAYTAKMTQKPGTFKMDFTGSQKNPEQRVAYFGEDIGLNNHHVTWHMDFPFWWDDHYGSHIDRKGELFFWTHHQLTVRFDVERLSNHLDLVDELYWDHPIEEGFAPHTTYRYSGEFPARPDHIDFEDVDGVAKIRDMVIMESRIRDAIAHGYVVDREGRNIDIRNEHGIDVLGDVIESSMYSPNTEYYGSLHNLAHIVLGRQADPHGKFNMPPGVMEHFETATRDPAFFRLHKYMDNIFKEHKDSLPPYTEADLDFEGVSLKSVTADNLETYFEDFKFSLINAVDDTPEIPDVEITATVSRLNHKPFDIKYDIENTGGEKMAIVRTFLCPKKDANGINFNYQTGQWICIELDKFWYKLTSGNNRVVRHSSDSSVTIPDRISFEELMDKTEAAAQSGSSLNLEHYHRSCGIPDRMLIPKGTPEGMEFYLLSIVTDGTADTAVEGLDKHDHGGTHSHCGIHGEPYPDKKPLGFPVDRHIPDERVFERTTNYGYTIVTITHKEH